MQTFVVDDVEVLVEGEGTQTVVMLHGWPDTRRLWDGQVEALRGRYRCVRFTLPGFDLARPPRACSLDEVVALTERIVRAASPGGPVILMLHDWGSVFGNQFALRHPQLVSRMVTVDVGDVYSPQFARSLGVGARLAIFSYQVWLALAWRIGGNIGDRMTRKMARAFRCPVDSAAVGSQMNYPYYKTWLSRDRSYRKAAPAMPSCPTLYFYGTRKPFMMHSEAWTASLNAKPGSAAVALDANHWVMRHPQFNPIVLDWLDKATVPAQPA